MLFLPHESFAPGEEAQGLTEYAVILLLVAIAVVAALTTFGGIVRDLYQKAVNAFPGSSGPNGAPDGESIGNLLRTFF